ncbi:major outer capsid protein [African horse sickness virus 6]|uniref:Outer capsid protein VP2 n=1 Tax=African horse sickness virus 6 TaxID=86060 RepID=A0A189RMM6_AHSV6|nr:major outer capsid protein [African horse sickness virus 6]
MAFEFGILICDKLKENTLEKTTCDVIITGVGKVSVREEDGILGYEWEETNHRLGLCEIENTVSISDFVYKQIRCEGAYPILPHYVTDVIKYGMVIDRNDHQIRVDRDEKSIGKIQIQPYFGDMYFSPEYYPATFVKREPLPISVDMIRDYIGARMRGIEARAGRIKEGGGNLLECARRWEKAAYERIENERALRCVVHETDPTYQILKKLRFGFIYPHYYVLNTDYNPTTVTRTSRINDWLLKEKTQGVVKTAEAYSDNAELKTLAERMEEEELTKDIIRAVIRYGAKYATRSGMREDTLSLQELDRYCDSLTTFVHKKKKDEGDDETARTIIRNQWIKGMPRMDFKKEMKITRGPIANWSFFMSIDAFKRNNKVDINPNHQTWKDHIKEVTDQMKRAQQGNSNKPLKIQIDGVSILTNEKYGTVGHWVDWVVDLIMLAQVKMLIKEYKFRRLNSQNLMSGMNKLVGALRCYAYCLILALYDYYGQDIEGFKKGSNSSAILETVIQMFPNFKQEIQANFGINLNIKDKKQSLFVERTMHSDFSSNEEYGYKFVFGWAARGEEVLSNYGDILSDEVEELFTKLRKKEHWDKVVEDPESYFVDELYQKNPAEVFFSAGYDTDQNVVIDGKMTEGVTYFSKRFVSYWYRVEKITTKHLEFLNEEDRKVAQFDFEDYKPMAIGEMGIHASTYKYESLLLGKNRGQKVKDSIALCNYDLALTNFEVSRRQDCCWISSCSAIELSMRANITIAIFRRIEDRRYESFAKILSELSQQQDLYFPTYKHYYLFVLQKVLRDERRIDQNRMCTELFDIQRRRGILLSFTTLRFWNDSEFLGDTLMMNFLLWVVFEMENVDVDYGKKWHPLLVSSEKGLRVIAVDVFNSMMGVSTSGWLPYVERICSESDMRRRLNADELELKRWFFDYYATLLLERRGEPRLSFKYEGLTTWIGSNCGGVRDYVVQLLPMRKPKPGLLCIAYGDDVNVQWVEHELRDFLTHEGSLGLVVISGKMLVNKSKLRVRNLKIYNRGTLDSLFLISGGSYTFGNKFLLSKLMAKAE